MLAQIDTHTREIIGWGSVLLSNDPANVYVVEILDSELAKLTQPLGRKTLNDDGTITVTQVPTPPDPQPIDYGGDDASIDTRTQLATVIKALRDYLAIAPGAVTVQQREAVLRVVIRAQLALMRTFVRTMG